MNFYQLPILIQWFIATILLLLGFYFVSSIDSLWRLPLLIFALPILQFCCTPLFRLLKIYKSLSPTVFSIFPSPKKYELHNITTFDYLQQFSWSDKGKPIQRKLLVNYAKAFLNIIDQIEHQQIPESVLIIGHSYFFSERTAKKLGFEMIPADKITVFCSCLNAVELIFLYSFSQGKWTIPKFWQVKAMFISGKELCKRRAIIQRLLLNVEKSAFFP